MVQSGELWPPMFTQHLDLRRLSTNHPGVKESRRHLVLWLRLMQSTGDIAMDASVGATNATGPDNATLHH